MSEAAWPDVVKRFRIVPVMESFRRHASRVPACLLGKCIAPTKAVKPCVQRIRNSLTLALVEVAPMRRRAFGRPEERVLIKIVSRHISVSLRLIKMVNGPFLVGQRRRV